MVVPRPEKIRRRSLIEDERLKKERAKKSLLAVMGKRVSQLEEQKVIRGILADRKKAMDAKHATSAPSQLTTFRRDPIPLERAIVPKGGTTNPANTSDRRDIIVRPKSTGSPGTLSLEERIEELRILLEQLRNTSATTSQQERINKILKAIIGELSRIKLTNGQRFEELMRHIKDELPKAVAKDVANALKVDLDSIKTELADIKTTQKQIDSIVHELNSKSVNHVQKISELIRELEKLRDEVLPEKFNEVLKTIFEDLPENIAELVARELDVNFEAITKRFDSLDTKIDQVHKDIHNIVNRRFTTVDAAVAKLVADLLSLKTQNEAEFKNILKELSKLPDLVADRVIARLGLNSADITAIKADLAELKKDQKDITTGVTELKKGQASITAGVAGLKKDHTDLATHLARVEKLISDLESGRIKNIDVNVTKLATEIADIKKQNKDLYDKLMVELINKFPDLAKRVAAELGIKPSDIDAIKKSLDTAGKEHSELAKSLAALTEEQKKQAEQIKKALEKKDEPPKKEGDAKPKDDKAGKDEKKESTIDKAIKAGQGIAGLGITIGLPLIIILLLAAMGLGFSRGGHVASRVIAMPVSPVIGSTAASKSITAGLFSGSINPLIIVLVLLGLFLLFPKK